MTEERATKSSPSRSALPGFDSLRQLSRAPRDMPQDWITRQTGQIRYGAPGPCVLEARGTA